MTAFISTLLAAAFIVSFAKLALLPRIYALIPAVLLVPAAWLFNSKIAATGQAQFMDELAGAGALDNWCAMLVIQELAFCAAAAAMLKADSYRERRPVWSYAAFFPSLLVPVGILWVKVLGFNHLLELTFPQISMITAAAAPLCALAVCEATRALFRGDNRAMLECLMQLEFIFVLLGVFLPVAARARFHHDAPPSDDIENGLMLTGAILAATLLAALISKFYEQYKIRRCRRELHCRNT